MSGKYSGWHKIQDVAPHAYDVHCASHNLNLGLKDAMEVVTKTCQFYDIFQSIYDFFGHSIVRWQKLQNVHDRYCSNPTVEYYCRKLPTHVFYFISLEFLIIICASTRCQRFFCFTLYF